MTPEIGAAYSVVALALGFAWKVLNLLANQQAQLIKSLSENAAAQMTLAQSVHTLTETLTRSITELQSRLEDSHAPAP